jgi:hypothetical protein
MRVERAVTRGLRAVLVVGVVLFAASGWAEDAKDGARPRPATCTTKADCAKACPPDAKGCDCRPTKRGDSRCTPICQADADCPTGKGGQGTCRHGFCAPPGGGHGPKACKTEQDCVGGCPPDAKGCGCHQTRRGDSKCAPTCKVDADCPSRSDDPHVCKDGFCRRSHPPAQEAR